MHMRCSSKDTFYLPSLSSMCLEVPKAKRDHKLADKAHRSFLKTGSKKVQVRYSTSTDWKSL